MRGFRILVCVAMLASAPAVYAGHFVTDPIVWTNTKDSGTTSMGLYDSVGDANAINGTAFSRAEVNNPVVQNPGYTPTVSSSAWGTSKTSGTITHRWVMDEGNEEDLPPSYSTIAVTGSGSASWTVMLTSTAQGTTASGKAAASSQCSVPVTAPQKNQCGGNSGPNSLTSTAGNNNGTWGTPDTFSASANVTFSGSIDLTGSAETSAESSRTSVNRSADSAGGMGNVTVVIAM